MRILIIGAGNTGRNLAAKLCELKHDIVVVDQSSEPLAALESQLDVLTVQGSGAAPDVLETAEAAKADLLIAVTDKDEVNILACLYAHAAGVSHKVARVSNPAFLRSPRLDLGKLGVDLMISYKEQAAEEIFGILRNPGLLEAVELLGGRLLIAGIRTRAGSPLVTAALGELSGEPLLSRLRVVAASRGEQMILPRGDTRFQEGDELYVAIKPDDLAGFLDWAHPNRHRFGRVVVAGGGGLGLELARRLESLPVPAVLLERDKARAGYCAEELKKTLVLHADASDQEALVNAGVGPDTAFVAITGDEELNIISCILADKLGAAFTVAQVTKPEYAPIIRNLSLLDRVVSPHLSMINAILHFVRGRHVQSATLLHEAPGEFLQTVVPEGHRWAGKTVSRLKIPGSGLIASVIHNQEIRVPTGEMKIEAGDQLVIFALPKDVNKVQALFGR